MVTVLDEIRARAAELMTYFGPSDNDATTATLRHVDYLVADVCDADIPLLLALADAAAGLFWRDPIVAWFNPLLGESHNACPFCYVDVQSWLAGGVFPHAKDCRWVAAKAAAAPLLAESAAGTEGK